MKKKVVFIFFALLTLATLAGFFLTARAAGCPLQAGKPYKTSSNPSVYYITPDCKKRPIRNPEVFFSHFSSWKEVKITSKRNLQRVPNHELSFLQLGPKKDYANGTVLKTATDPRVYVVSDGGAYPIESESAFTDIGLKWDWIEVVEPDVLSKFSAKPVVASAEEIPTHLLFKYPDSAKVYAIDRDSSGNLVKRDIESYEEMARYYRPDRIITFAPEKTLADGNAFQPLEEIKKQDSSTTNNSQGATNQGIATSTLPTPTTTVPATTLNHQPTISWGGGSYGTPAAPAPVSPPGTVNLYLAMAPSANSTTPSTTILYSLAYRNYGTGTATGVTVTETVPANSFFSAASSTGSWDCANNAPAGSVCTGTIGSVEPGATSTIIFAAAATSSYEGSLSNSASISDSGSLGSDTDSTNNSASTTVSVSGDPDISLNVSMNTATTTVSSTVLYNITYQNLGTIDAPGVMLTATVPSGTIFYAASSTGSWSCADGAVAFSTCTSSVGVVQIGQSATKTFAVKGWFTTPAYMSGWQADAVLENFMTVSSTVSSTLSISTASTYGRDTNPTNNTSTKPLLLTIVPLSDMGTEITYKGFTGGLYANGSNTAPTAHRAAGLAAAAQIQPLDIYGNPASTGTIVMMSMGMSNTSHEFCTTLSFLTVVACDSFTFMGQAASSSQVNHTTLTILNGARGGQTAETWNSATSTNMLDGSPNNYDLTRDNRLTPSGLSERQVQVLWLKVTRQTSPLVDWRTFYALPGPTAEAFTLERFIGNIIRAAKTRYPNLRQIFLSSRIFGYDPTANGISNEPGTYENGFSVKWIIQAQIDQMANGGVVVDQNAGDLNYNTTTSPWIGWGPYLWANAKVPRGDGLTWNLADMTNDRVHPNQSGRTKVANMLMDFFLNSEYTPWFRP